MRRALLLLAAIAAGTGALVAAPSNAQRVDPKRPRTLIVGAPRGAAPMDRVDARRTGLASTPLPSGTLRIAWKRNLGFTITHAPLVGPSGDVSLVTSRGDVFTLDADGAERAHIAVGSAAISGGALLSDGTVVFLDGANEAVGVQLGGVRFKTRLAGDRTGASGAKLAPLPLEDGGAVVAGATELTTIDAEGNVRARTAMREALAGPLLIARGMIVAIAASGTVYLWSPSTTAREPMRVGSFGGAVDGGAALEGDHTLVAVVDGGQLAELDLARGITVARASAAGVGATYFLGPPALRGETATFLALTPTRTFLLTIDAAGQEVARQGIAFAATALLPDGGAPAVAIPPHVGPIVDARGAVAFAAPDAQAGGQVGVISAGGALDVLGESLCAARGSGSAIGGSSGISSGGRAAAGVFAGLAPAGAGAFIVACESGVVAKVVGGSGSGE